MNLLELIKKNAKEHIAPDGTQYIGLSLAAEIKIAESMDVSRRDVEIRALNARIIPLRYHRNIGSIGIDGQVKLLQACVAVVGCGGLGGLVIELLARTGIGKIKVIDNENYTEENLNRQAFSSEDSVLSKKKKIDMAKNRIDVVNSAVETETHSARLEYQNAENLLSDVNVIVDALDNIHSRFVLQEVAKDLGIPLVSAAIAGFCGYLTVIMPGDKGWKAFYDHKIVQERGVEKEWGNLGPTASMAAALEAQEVVKLLTGKGVPLRNRFLFFNTEDNDFIYIDVI